MAPLAVSWAAGIPTRLIEASRSQNAILIGQVVESGSNSLTVCGWISAEEHSGEGGQDCGCCNRADSIGLMLFDAQQKKFA